MLCYFYVIAYAESNVFFFREVKELEGDHQTCTNLGEISTTQLEAPKKSPLRHHKAWEDLYNLIGGPQEIATEAPQSLGRSPQLNWRSPSYPLSH
jgi:hypothetical protein